MLNDDFFSQTDAICFVKTHYIKKLEVTYFKLKPYYLDRLQLK